MTTTLPPAASAAQTALSSAKASPAPDAIASATNANTGHRVIPNLARR